MSEDELLKQVERLCDERKLSYVHYPDSRRLHGQAGFPDLVIAGNHRLLFVELKSQYGTMSPGQTKWKWHLQALGCHWTVWRPSDLRKGYVQRTLDEL